MTGLVLLRGCFSALGAVFFDVDALYKLTFYLLTYLTDANKSSNTAVKQHETDYRSNRKLLVTLSNLHG